MKRDLHMSAYVRYVVDLFLFVDGRADLRRWRGEVAGWLARDRDLWLKQPDTRVPSCAGQLDALGRRVTRGPIEPTARGWRTAEGAIGAYLRDGRATA